MRMLFQKGTYGHILIYRICNSTYWLTLTTTIQPPPTNMDRRWWRQWVYKTLISLSVSSSELSLADDSDVCLVLLRLFVKGSSSSDDDEDTLSLTVYTQRHKHCVTLEQCVSSLIQVSSTMQWIQQKKGLLNRSHPWNCSVWNSFTNKLRHRWQPVEAMWSCTTQTVWLLFIISASLINKKASYHWQLMWYSLAILTAQFNGMHAVIIIILSNAKL